MDYIARRNAMVEAVTQADIRRAAARTFADGKMLVVAAAAAPWGSEGVRPLRGSGGRSARSLSRRCGSASRPHTGVAD